jgi:hypothetical protein
MITSIYFFNSTQPNLQLFITLKKNKMKKIITLLFLIALSFEIYAQGCVAIRSTGGMTNLIASPDSLAAGGGWIFTANNRYFKSFRHFVGTEEQKERLEIGNEVINYQYALDMALTRVFNERWSAMIDIPILANKRTSMYEHGFNERGATHSFGIGDIRLAAYRWLLNPARNKNGNIQLGLGLKLPTGDYDYKDFWTNIGPNGEPELRTVDQSIQLGDGGTGITLELNVFQRLNHHFGLYGNFYYLSNPREHNGVRTYREVLSPQYADRLANEAISSVPDQYMVRGGVDYFNGSFSASIGGRIECVPVHDVLGRSGHFRRPGLVVSVEPGVAYQIGGAQLFATVPVALVRNRTQSVTDKQYSDKVGTFTQGDAAFADYSINFGVSFRFQDLARMVSHSAPEIFNNLSN